MYSSRENKDFESSAQVEEINLGAIFNFLIRNKNFFGSIALIFVIFGYIFSFLPKKTWEGQFQIVVNLDDKNLNSFPKALTSSFPSFGGLSSTSSLKTEVGILQSPSVLMPAFETMISKQDESSENIYEFSEWKKSNLNIELQKGTSILNIAYRDKDKSIILPVLEKMSSTYQKYSVERKRRQNLMTQNYLKNQIKIFKLKSSDSLKFAQEYAIDQDLFFDFDIRKSPNSSLIDEREFSMEYPPMLEPSKRGINANANTFMPQNIGIEELRVNAANDIRKIDLQLKKIDKLKDFEELQYIGLTIPALIEAELPQALQEIENNLVKARSKYTDNDNTVKRILEERDLIIELLKKRSINYLKARKLENEAILESSSRPKGVLLKYKELIRNAARDENTLINLENQLRFVELDNSRIENPWELITKPTLLKKPIGSSKLPTIFISVLIGLIIAIIFRLYKEKNSGNIFELSEILKLITFGFIEKINLAQIQSNSEKLFFLKDFINNQGKEKVNIILLGDLGENKKNQIKEIFRQELDKKSPYFINLEDILRDIKQNNIIILSLGLIKYSEIEMLRKYQELLNINLSGLILID